MRAPERLAAVVLAGGSSSRMGRDKAWLPWGDSTLYAHVTRALARTCDPIVVVGKPDRGLPPAHVDAEVNPLSDPPHRRGRGPLAAVATGLESLDSGTLAVLATCDNAGLSPASIAALRERLDAHEAAAFCAAGRLHPFPALVRVDPALAAAERLLGQGDRRALSLLEALDTVAVEASPPFALVVAPCNTPEQYAALREAADPGHASS